MVNDILGIKKQDFDAERRIQKEFEASITAIIGPAEAAINETHRKASLYSVANADGKNLLKETDLTKLATHMITRGKNIFFPSFSTLLKGFAGKNENASSVKGIDRTKFKISEYVKEKHDCRAVNDIVRGTIYFSTPAALISSLKIIVTKLKDVLVSIKDRTKDIYGYILIQFIFKVGDDACIAEL